MAAQVSLLHVTDASSPADRRPEVPAVYRRSQEGDAAGILKLLQRAFPEWPRVGTGVGAAEHFAWKRSSHPRAAEAAVVADLGGRIIASCGAFVSDAILRGRPCIVANGVDLAVDPEFQGRGVYGRLSAERVRACEPFDFVLQDFSGDTTREVAMRSGYAILANEVDVLRWRRSRIARVVRPVRGSRPAADLAIGPLEFADPAIGELFSQAAPAFAFIRDRTPKRLAWRFGDRRAGRFEALAARTGGGLAGYVVFSSGNDRGAIADLLVAPDRPDVVQALANAAIAKMVAAGATAIRCWLPSVHAYRAPLIAAGFEPTGLVAAQHYRAFALEEPALSVFQDPCAPVHLMLGDSDVV